jgi:hypothetical protein
MALDTCDRCSTISYRSNGALTVFRQPHHTTLCEEAVHLHSRLPSLGAYGAYVSYAKRHHKGASLATARAPDERGPLTHTLPWLLCARSAFPRFRPSLCARLAPLIVQHTQSLPIGGSEHLLSATVSILTPFHCGRGKTLLSYTYGRCLCDSTAE